MIDRRTNSSRRQNVKLVLASLAVLSACAHPNRPVSPIESDTLAYSSAISDARQELFACDTMILSPLLMLSGLPQPKTPRSTACWRQRWRWAGRIWMKS